MAKDRFGFGKEEIQWDDPWGDNIFIPYKDGKPIRGKDAAKYTPYGGGGFQDILFKGHTGQEITAGAYKKEELKDAVKWYLNAMEKVRDPESQEEIQRVLGSLSKQMDPSDYAGFFGGEDFAEELQRLRGEQ
jgi:hypothetical protein